MRWRWWCAPTGDDSSVGGHISSYASAATLYEVGFNHFFRASSEDHEGDVIYFQGHASPGVYARAFLEGRLTKQDLENFRKELQPEGGLSSYPSSLADAPTSGNSPQFPWDSPRLWRFIRLGLCATLKIGV